MKGATIWVVGEAEPRRAAVTYQTMPEPNEFVMKLTNLNLTPQQANFSIVCIDLTFPCPNLEVSWAPHMGEFVSGKRAGEGPPCSWFSAPGF